MSLHRLLRQTCVIERPGRQLEDEFGQPVYDDMGDPVMGDPIREEARCWLASTRALEMRDGGIVAVEELRLHLEPGVNPVPTAGEHITVDGDVFTLEGPAQRVESPRTGRSHHLVAKVRQVT